MLDWLVELRGSHTQAAIAQKIGIAQSTYASIEIGIRKPSVAMAKRIADVMGFPWTSFFSKCAGLGELNTRWRGIYGQ